MLKPNQNEKQAILFMPTPTNSKRKTGYTFHAHAYNQKEKQPYLSCPRLPIQKEKLAILSITAPTNPSSSPHKPVFLFDKCVGLVVECLTRDRGAAGSSLTVDTALFP